MRDPGTPALCCVVVVWLQLVNKGVSGHGGAQAFSQTGGGGNPGRR